MGGWCRPTPRLAGAHLRAGHVVRGRQRATARSAGDLALEAGCIDQQAVEGSGQPARRTPGWPARFSRPVIATSRAPVRARGGGSQGLDRGRRHVSGAPADRRCGGARASPDPAGSRAPPAYRTPGERAGDAPAAPRAGPGTAILRRSSTCSTPGAWSCCSMASTRWPWRRAAGPRSSSGS